MHASRPETRAEARAAKDELLAMLDRQGPGAATRSASDPTPPGRDVLGVGWGAKLVGGTTTGEPAVRVYVRSKQPRRELPRALRIPEEVNGIATDVVQVGDLSALARPARGGTSIGHIDSTAGTLGCLVTLEDEGEDCFVLSNSHVLAQSGQAEVGDRILEPGPVDGGDPDDPLALLHAAVPLDRSGQNTVDAAVARPLDPADVDPSVLTIGPLAGPPLDAALYQGVRKHGRTTQHTVGVVVDVAADIQVRFGAETITFIDQLAVIGAGSLFSEGGDSGSLVVDGVSRRPVGLLFAGGGDTTFCNPIDLVVDALGAQVVTGDETESPGAPVG